MSDFAAARQHMVDSQIRPNKVNDPAIVAALGSLPRETFVPERLRGVAYIDEDIDLGGGRYLMEPMVLARLLQEAAPSVADIGLVAGAGSGYSAAVLASICSTVVALEPDPALAGEANAALTALGIDNAAVVQGPLSEGCPSQAPFGVILFDGAVDEVPAAYFEQLEEGGRLAAVLAPDGGIGRATLFTKADGRIGRRALFDAAIHHLPGLLRTPDFVF
jgi:protein-L-isoaspartate(D-aspartate) O-methyltransferase